MIRLPLDSIKGDNGPGITVERGDDGAYVYLGFESEVGDEPPDHRILLPFEARALAAMLVHFADEVER